MRRSCFCCWLLLLSASLVLLLAVASTTASGARPTTGTGHRLHASDRDGWLLRRHLGSKTPYYPQQNYTEWRPAPEGCHAVHFNLLARHGSRRPSSSDIEAFQEIQEIIDTYDEVDPYPWMRNWTNPYDQDEADDLTVQGEYEHYYMAKRFLAAYSDLLKTHAFSPSRFSIRSTELSRAGASASSFSFGLFEGRGHVGPTHFDPFFILTNNATTDNELRFFKTCPNYYKGVKKNKTANVESKKYADANLPLVAERLTQRINITGWTVTPDQVRVLWLLCQFEVSATETYNQFCSFFEQEDVEIMNYIDDLSSYWVKGYGYPINYNIACVLLSNMVEAMDTVIKKPVSPQSLRGTLRFAHAETIMPLVSLLGLHKDEKPLFANATQEQIANRKWRESQISTFAANVALILYNCSVPGGKSEYVVKLYHQEKEMVVPGCEAHGLYCPLPVFKQIYEKPLKQCNFDSMCGIKPCPDSGGSDGGGEDSNTKWMLTSLRGRVILAFVALGGIILGMALLGAIVGIIWCCFGKRREDYSYELADSIVL